MPQRRLSFPSVPAQSLPILTDSVRSVFRGARGYRRVLSVLAVALLAGLVAVLVDSVLLPGADSGLEHLIRFDWNALLNVEVGDAPGKPHMNHRGILIRVKAGHPLSVKGLNLSFFGLGIPDLVLCHDSNVLFHAYWSGQHCHWSWSILLQE